MSAPPANAASIPRVGPGTSLTQQVLDAMIGAIRLGAFPEGRLPPEDQLASLLGVSRTTVRRALQSLEQIGVVERRPGRGTRLRAHISPALMALHGLVPFPTLLRELGHEVTSKVSWRQLDAVEHGREPRLDRNVAGAGYEVDVALFADGEPAVAMVERFPLSALRETPADADLQAGSILFVSERCFIEKIHHAVASIEPRVHGADAACGSNGLALAPGTPYLALYETFYSSAEEPLATSEVSINHRYVGFSVFRRFV